jgi:hypothetical protein
LCIDGHIRASSSGFFACHFFAAYAHFLLVLGG